MTTEEKIYKVRREMVEEMLKASGLPVDDAHDLTLAFLKMHEDTRETRPIVPWAIHGQHIKLTCVDHTGLRWSTKNIDYIGARNIFWGGTPDELQDECTCHMGLLVPVVPVDWRERVKRNG